VKIYKVFQGDLPYFIMILRLNYIDIIEKYLYLELTVMEMWQEVSKNTNKYNY